MEFLKFIKSQIRKSCDGTRTNYQHTHDRVHFNAETRFLWLEEVCINEYGSCYGTNVGFGCTVPQTVDVPSFLVENGWSDFEYLPANYGYHKQTQTTQRKR